jgi:hypothetical protein
MHPDPVHPTHTNTHERHHHTRWRGVLLLSMVMAVPLAVVGLTGMYLRQAGGPAAVLGSTVAYWSSPPTATIFACGRSSEAWSAAAGPAGARVSSTTSSRSGSG